MSVGSGECCVCRHSEAPCAEDAPRVTVDVSLHLEIVRPLPTGWALSEDQHSLQATLRWACQHCGEKGNAGPFPMFALRAWLATWDMFALSGWLGPPTAWTRHVLESILREAQPCSHCNPQPHYRVP